MASDWCGRLALYSARHASTAACASSMLANGSCTFSSSCCRIWCSRSILPVVVGEGGLVSRWVMPFSRQIRSNSTSAGRGLPNRPVNTLPLNVRQHLSRHAIGAHRGHERRAHRPAGGPQHTGGDDTEPGVVVDPSDDLAFAAIGQEQACGDIELPQLHRYRAFPPPVLLTALTAWHRFDQLMADQHPVDRRPGQARIATASHLKDQAARAPPAMRPAQLADHRLDLGAGPPRMLFRRMGAVGLARSGYSAEIKAG
jgi:hypothetical protein